MYKVFNKKLIKILLSLIIILLLFLILIPIVIMPKLLNKRFEQIQYDSQDFGINSVQINLHTKDNLKLTAWKTYSTNTKGTVIILSV